MFYDYLLVEKSGNTLEERVESCRLLVDGFVISGPS